MKKLSLKQILVMGGALFSMHFGASCLLYPLTWGKESGSGFLMAYLGVFLSGILITILGYTALARGKDSFLGLSSAVSPAWGRIYCTAVVLLVGPVYMMPRMTAAAWDAIRQLYPVVPDSPWVNLLFNLAMYAVIFWFTSSRSKIVDKVGKILFPLQIVIVLAVIIKGLITPVSGEMIARSYSQPSFVYGFLQGYSTGDLQCALMFGLVVIGNLTSLGLEGAGLRKYLVRIGMVGIGILAASHFGHMLVGAHIGDTYSLTLSALYAEVVVHLWGEIGGIVFVIALLSAAISCAIGLTASSAEFLMEVSDKRLHYLPTTIGICLLAAAISCLGLSRIVTILGALLQASYPAAILLVVYYTFMPDFERPERKRALLWALLTATACALLHAVNTYNLQFQWGWDGFSRFYAAIPLAQYDFAWVPFSLLAFVIALACGRSRIKPAHK